MNPTPPPVPQPQPPAPRTPAPEPPLPDTLDTRSLFEALLRSPRSLGARLVESSNQATGRFAILALISLVLFGVVLGCFAKHEQLWAAPLKITCGLLFAGVICYPSLYIFSTLAGARVSAGQLAATLAGALALAGALLLGFAPAVWIFAESTDSLGFMGFLSVAAWLIALFFAVRFLNHVVFAAGATQKGPLGVWTIVFLLVTLQMTTSLRPILGRSGKFLTSEKKFFLQHWGEQMDRTLPRTAERRGPARE